MIKPEASAEDTTPIPVPIPEPGNPEHETTERKHRLSVDDPKSKQFTGRATTTEYDRIQGALEVRKPEGKTYDIVRLCLDMLDHIEDDFFQTFKTKKKK